MKKGMTNVGSGEIEVLDICDRCEHFSRIYISSHGYLCRRCMSDEMLLKRL